MSGPWLELIFLLVLMVALKLATFSNTSKLILFSVYVILGILTKSLWLPVIICIGLFYYFHNTDSET